MPERHRILIVDDDPQDRLAVVNALRREVTEIDVDVREAGTIAEARLALDADTFACVFLDHGLPDGTSLDLLDQLRSRGLSTPVVVLTGKRDEQAIVEVMRAGAVDYLPKEKLHPDLIARSLRAALHFFQAQMEKEAAITELRQFQFIADHAADPFFLMDQDGCFVYVNGAACRSLGYSAQELQSMRVPDVDPRHSIDAFRALFERAKTEPIPPFETMHRRADGTTLLVEASVSFLDISGRCLLFCSVRDMSDRRRADEDLRRRAQRERLLLDLAERARQYTDPDVVIADAVESVARFLNVGRCVFGDIDLNADLCSIVADFCADSSLSSIVGQFPFSEFGPFVVAEYESGRAVAVDDIRTDPLRVPASNVAPYESMGIRAHVTVPVVHSSRLVSVIAVHSQTPRHWTEDEIELLRTVMERTWLTVEVLRQQRELANEASATSRILESITDAFFAVDREWRFTYLNAQGEALLSCKRDDLVGKNVWAEFPAAVGTAFDFQYHRAVETQVAVTFEEYYPPPLDTWFEVRAYPSADGLSVYFHDINERKRADTEREEMLAEQHARAEREALLNRVGQELRRSSDPEQVLQTVVQLVGEALGVGRCYYAAYNQDRDVAVVGPEWHQEGLPPLTGTYAMSDFRINRDPIYKSGLTQVLTDTPDDPATAQLGLRALVRVPLVSGTTMTALSVAMVDGPRAWTAAEISLIEAIATQTQTTLEAVRIQRREHRIAEQLQDALQPGFPAHIPGLDVGKYTHPALDEAQIGGDFYDIFPLDKHCYAIVIGDVSGKGLAAAQQLALIRNSLRTTIYLYRDPAQAAAALNGIVTVHDLLVGFVTAFVGIYDVVTGEVQYCSCGHEPGLVRRMDGSVDELWATGPPLGVAEEADYTPSTVVLAPGDTLLLYTDGISEAGPSRQHMLGTDGLTEVLAHLPLDRDAQAAAKELVDRVSTFADGVFRDDVAVLLARRV